MAAKIAAQKKAGAHAPLAQTPSAANGTGPAAHRLKGAAESSQATAKSLKKSSNAVGTQASGGDYEKFRELLLAVRRRLKGDVDMMSQEALGGSDGAADNHAPIHPAEVGTHSFEQEFTLNLLSSDGDRLERIEAALEKIGEGTYGACDECGSRIPRARLEIIPDTPFCVKCATRLEV